MASSNLKTLVVGAAGRYAGLVVAALAARGVTVRGLVHKNEQSLHAQQNGAAEIVSGDLRDPASIERALRGVDSAFYIPPYYQEDEAQMGLPFVKAAKNAGVRRIVFSSGIHPVIQALESHSEKAPVEAAIIESGMEFTILQPTVFFQVLAPAWPIIVETGVYAEPFSKVSRVSRVDYRDVAEVAAMALTEDRLLNGTFELCADAGTTREEVAAIMGEVTELSIEAATPDFATWLAEAKLPITERQKDALAKMYVYYDRFGLVGSPLTLAAILGREPRSLRQFIADLEAGVMTTAAA